MVEGYFVVSQSAVLADDQKLLVMQKLRNKINSAGVLQVRSQVHRSQLGNKVEVARKMNELIAKSLKKEKRRIATKPSAGAKAKRLEGKKKQSEHKQNRQRIRFIDP